MAQPAITLKLSCADQPGIVAKISGYVAGYSGNLIEFAQWTDQLSSRFYARLEIETSHLQVSADDFIAGFGTLGRSLKADWSFRRLPHKVRTAVLVTKTDHCLQEILWRINLGELPVEITSVIGNRENCRPTAEQANLAFHHIPMDGNDKLAGFEKIQSILRDEEVELVVLARFMQILPSDICQQWTGKVINIHHSFLPAFIGANPYRQAYDRGVKLIGATCHYVSSELDAGPIIEQEVERVYHFHTPQDLARLGRDCERRALSRGIRYHVNDRTIIDGNRAIVFHD